MVGPNGLPIVTEKLCPICGKLTDLMRMYNLQIGSEAVEQFCVDCYSRGIIWAVKKAHEEVQDGKA